LAAVAWMERSGAVTRRLVDVLLHPENLAPIGAKSFDGKRPR
jgi:hypothetical protein